MKKYEIVASAKKVKKILDEYDKLTGCRTIYYQFNEVQFPDGKTMSLNQYEKRINELRELYLKEVAIQQAAGADCVRIAK